MNVKDQIPLISKNNHLNLNINGYISMFFVVVFSAFLQMVRSNVSDLPITSL